MIRAIAIVVCAIAAAALPARAQGVLECRVTQKFSCVAGRTCATVAPTTWNVVDVGGQSYARCDQRGCDKYPASFNRSGLFTIIDVPRRGMVAKIDDTGGFLEVVTIGLDALISHGACRVKQ